MRTTIADPPDEIVVDSLPRVGEPGHRDWYVMASWKCASKKTAEVVAKALRDQLGARRKP